MNDLKDNKKILFIPGWLDSGELHGYKNSLDIWNKNINIKKNFNVDFVIAHSAGILVALYNWNIHKNFKIILINPIFSKKNILKKWFKMMIYEGTQYSFKRIIIFFSVVPALIKIIKLFKIPIVDIINSIPRDNLIIIYGEKDKYFCNKQLIHSFKDRFKIIEVRGAGHNYNIDIEKAIINIIQ